LSWADPVELVGETVRLRPLTLEDAPSLFEAGVEPSIWAFLIAKRPESVSDIETYIQGALDGWKRGDEVPFVVELSESGRVVGTTRYLEMRPEDHALEIGWTWYAADAQRTRVNTECKLLLLTQAFEVMGARRVQLKTDGRNERSQRAIERIGAQFEGRLRRNRVLYDGFVRDTVYYSILDDEWPDVKRRLIERLS
jgi:RimJ/RimL family protein N-acetyltransferase